MQLSYAQFTQDSDYSQGSVREQLIHLINADEIWFCELQGIQPTPPLSPAGNDDREEIRLHWDRIEKNMRNYLADLTDDHLFEKPIKEPEEDQDLFVWQVLLHVVNHGTDHRAQLLRNINDLGFKTGPQDYIYYIYDNP